MITPSTTANKSFTTKAAMIVFEPEEDARMSEMRDIYRLGSRPVGGGDAPRSGGDSDAGKPGFVNHSPCSIQSCKA